MTTETSPALLHKNPTEIVYGFRPQNSEFSHNVSKETAINAGIKVAAAAIFTIGLYKVVTADSFTDLIIGGVLMYAGYKIFTHKSQKAT
ncbi:hypothetical protein A3A49_02650 [Candidatus Curtissbacteria bacterium RIFCSPLOWO2_01_FULL_38_11b]|uniref:Uncharacterized protein n=1 Tax=Candidatus Curtissbacteria bacterium RIFCSPLOWO2_01_FULL_38_11b TaxID=1797725 RepID=A0A1F5H3X3_9BACT|nr:MAG: hypothetical protein A3A49_02650 [Candidatus Curtissbacteria bacterium RIFCSPLOWO2_01_FULL_38_11b]